MRILITGFEHYGRTQTNPSQIVTELIEQDKQFHSFWEERNVEICTMTVPNNFYESIDVVTNKITLVQPDFVIMIGEFPGRVMITCERVATNINDSSRYGLSVTTVLS